MRRLSLSVVAILGLAGCGSTAAPSHLSGRITVSAAASLTDAFAAVAKAFAAANPGVSVSDSFGGSPALVAQIEQGAPVDVIATADLTTMQRLQRDSLLQSDPAVFARNRLEIAVAPGNPLHI